MYVVVSYNFLYVYSVGILALKMFLNCRETTFYIIMLAVKETKFKLAFKYQFRILYDKCLYYVFKAL